MYSAMFCEEMITFSSRESLVVRELIFYVVLLLNSQIDILLPHYTFVLSKVLLIFLFIIHEK